MTDLSQIIKAYDVRGVVGEQIDTAVVAAIGAALARLLRSEGAERVVIGHDMRDSSPELSRAFAAGVTGQGLDVVHIGLASTDMLYFASGTLDAPGAMFTASHNPARYNGIKLCRAGASPIGQDTGLSAIMQKRGYTTAQIGTCLDSEVAQAEIAGMTNIGQNADRVAGTPTFFINGRNAAVVQWTALKTKLDAALKGS